MRSVTGLVLLLMALGFLYWAGQQPGFAHSLPMATLEEARRFYSLHPALTIVIFCLAHLVSTMLSLPGSATTLNVLAGAVFGFTLGCLVVYPVTLLSGCLVYGIASKLRTWGPFERLGARFGRLKMRLGKRDFLFLVALRLSPLLPYSWLNVLMGLVGLPFRLFFVSTLVGVFFDVTLLNSLGASVTSAKSHDTAQPYTAFFLLFSLLLALASFAVSRMSRRAAAVQEDSI